MILLLFAADPTGLQAAFESAETVDMTYDRTGFKVTLVNPETIKKLSPLAEVRGEEIKSLGKPATPDIIRVTIRGKMVTEFWMIESKIAAGDMMFTPADDKLWVALRACFEPAVLVKERIPGRLPERTLVQESMQKTLTAAMKGADKLEVTYRRVKVDWGLNDPIKEVWGGNLKMTGDITYYAKQPEDPVEVVFVSKETRIPIYLVGDTAYWGSGKHWKSVKLTTDSLWKQFVTRTPTPEEIGLQPDPDDASGLAAAIESADSIDAARVGGETESLKGSLTLKKEDIQGLGKYALGVGKPVSFHGKDEPDAIDIVVKKGKESRKYRLIEDTLVFDKDRSVKMENKLLWMNMILKLQKSDQ
jgi:hypothetical protein